MSVVKLEKNKNSEKKSGLLIGIPFINHFDILGVMMPG